MILTTFFLLYRNLSHFLDGFYSFAKETAEESPMCHLSPENEAKSHWKNE